MNRDLSQLFIIQLSAGAINFEFVVKVLKLFFRFNGLCRFRLHRSDL
jgi:hypothetical protein